MCKCSGGCATSRLCTSSGSVFVDSCGALRWVKWDRTLCEPGGDGPHTHDSLKGPCTIFVCRLNFAFALPAGIDGTTVFGIWPSWHHTTTAHCQLIRPAPGQGCCKGMHGVSAAVGLQIIFPFLAAMLWEWAPYLCAVTDWQGCFLSCMMLGPWWACACIVELHELMLSTCVCGRVGCELVKSRLGPSCLFRCWRVCR